MPADASRMRCQGGSAAVIVPCTYGSGADAKKLAGVGTALPFVAVESGEFEINVGGASSGSSDKVTATLANGVTVEQAKVTKTYNKTTGVTSDGGSSSTDGEKLTLVILEHDKQFLLDMKSLKGVPIIVCAPLEDEDGGGFGYILGKLTGTIKSSGKGNTFKSSTITIVGQVFEKTSAFTHTIINGAVGTLEQLAGADLDPTDLISGDVTTLLTGEVVLK